jgi:hypothetical protein
MFPKEDSFFIIYIKYFFPISISHSILNRFGINSSYYHCVFAMIIALGIKLLFEIKKDFEYHAGLIKNLHKEEEIILVKESYRD